MKIKTLIPFVVILAILVGIVAWQKATEAPPAPIATQIGLETLVPEGLTQRDVARIELFSGTDPEEKVILERDGDAWRIASLYDAPVNTDTLDSFIEKALSLKGEPRATADTDVRLAEFSLTDGEAFHVHLFRSGADTPAMNVLVGKSADFRTVFLRKADDNRVYVESANLRREAGVSDTGAGATPKPTKWLQTTLLELDRDKINRVALQYPHKQMVFERHEVVVETPEDADDAEESGEEDALFLTPEEPETTYEWKLVAGGFSESYTDSEFQTLLGKFAMLTITNAVDPEKKSDWGFDPPMFKVTIGLEDDEEVVLLGGRETPAGDTYIQLVGAEPENIFQISKFNFDQIFPQGSKLFTLPEWSVEKETITRIEIARPEGRVALARDGEDWQVVDPEVTLDVQKTAIDNLVATASSFKPADYVDAGQEVGAFDIVITIHAGEEQTRTLYVGQPAKNMDGRYVRFDDSDAVLTLSRADMEKLLPPTRDLFTLSVLDFEMSAIERIHVAHEALDIELKRDPDDRDAWIRMVNGESARALANDVEDLVYTLNAFQVDNFLFDREPSEVQTATTITVAQVEKPLVTLQLSAEENDMIEATISGLSYVFSVKADELSRIVEDLEPLTEMPEAIEETTESDVESNIEDDTADDVGQADIVIPIDATETSAPAFEVMLDLETPDDEQQEE